MSRVLDAFKWTISRGKDSQNFLGARWIGWFLSKTSDSKRRIWALRILSMSPHYFLDRNNPKYAGMSNDEYLNATFDALVVSREDIYQKILKPHLSSNDVVLDYGCGPGFLSRVVAPHVKNVFGIDISSGAVECANILNKPDNVKYFVSDENGLSQIPDNGIDVIYSFAVIQHLTDDVFEFVLSVCKRKLRTSGGRLILHIQLSDDVWVTENEHKANTSIQGKIKYEIGLHCFGRTEERHVELLTKHGFEVKKIVRLDELVPELAHEIHSQRILVATAVTQ